MALRLRRGTNAERTAITPEAGELVFTTDTKKVFVGDGTTTGGIIVSGQNDIVDDGTPQLGGDLDLNGNNITGTGNINITGTITATGNINLGDGAGGDVLSIGGVLSGNLIADAADAYTIGSSAVRYAGGFFNELTVTGNMTADSIQADIIGDDSVVIVNAGTGAITGTLTGNVTGNLTGSVTGTLTGEVTGSVFADDSTLMVDAINNFITAPDITSTRYTGGNIKLTDFTPRGQGTIQFTRKVAGVITESDDRPSGIIYFGRDDDNGLVEIQSAVTGGKNHLRFIVDPVGNDISGLGDTTTQLTWKHDNGYNKFGVGYRNPPGPERLQVNGDAAIAGYIEVDQVKIVGNTISTNVSNANLELSANGTGTIELGNSATVNGSLEVNQIRIVGNTISTNVSNANLELSANGTGTIELDIPTQTTVGSAGAAAAVPATPSTYFKINVGGTDYVVPAFAVS